MNKDVPVAELNFPSVRPGKFTWDLSPAELANTSRKHRSDFPEYHIQLEIKNDSTVPLTSTPIINPISVPLPDSGEISWDSDNSLKSNNKPKVIIKQPNSSISPVLVDKISDTFSPSYSNAALAKNVVLDLHASSFAANDNINIAAATEPDVIVAPVVQNLPAVEGEDPGVGIDPVVPGPVDIHPAPAVPDPVGAQPVPIVLGFADIQPAPVVQGPLNAPFVVPLILDGDNNNDSSEDESIGMTDNVIAPPYL